MAFWDRWKKKKQNTVTDEEDETYLDPELDLEKEFAKRKRTKDEDFDRIENLQYVRTQCEQVAESSRYIQKMKHEYRVVNSYLKDIQIIDTLENDKREALRHMAEEAVKLGKKREKYRRKQNNLPQSRTAIYEQYKDDFPEALTEFQNDEKYLQAVKHDMKILEAEKVNLKEDIRSGSRRRVTVRNVALIFLFVVLAVFAIFIATSQLNSESGQTAFMIIMAVAVCIVVGLVLIMTSSAYRVKLSEKKLARAVTLLNKTKIKYVNIANSVDYRKAKYKVKNSYQLSHEYELYLMDLKAAEKYDNSTREMDATISSVMRILEGLNLYDTAVWESQLEALADNREMVEVRHSLNVRRQKLREQIDYNMGLIENAKKGIIDFMKKHPEEATAVMEIVDSYDVEME